jgi:uncharacterized phage protein (TIGR01671 family)
MREIKFRMWDTEFEEFVNPHYSLIGLNTKYIFQQYIGLKDKNGVEIYEGDIVRWGMNGQEYWLRYANVELFPSLQFRILYYIDEKTLDKKPTYNHVIKFGRFVYQKTEKYLEVIGNIYENPEILNI